MELGYKMILNLPDLRLMENKKELYESLNTKQHSAKEYREIHKALKKYNDGLFLKDRHPYFPAIASTVSLIVSVVVLIARIVL